MKPKNKILIISIFLIFLFLSYPNILKIFANSKNSINIKRHSITKKNKKKDINEGKIIFKNKCSQCHTLNRSLEKTKSLSGWKKTTSRMARKTQDSRRRKGKNRRRRKNKIGKKISQKEAEKIAKYLYFLNTKKK